MNVSRSFVLVGAVYLTLGIILGIYMGASGNHAPAAAHAHINLLGFTLMTLFGIAYRIFPDMAGNRMAVAHFWTHLAGSLVLLIMLFMLTMGMMGEASMVPLAPIAEIVILLGVLTFLVNAFQNAR